MAVGQNAAPEGRAPTVAGRYWGNPGGLCGAGRAPLTDLAAARVVPLQRPAATFVGLVHDLAEPVVVDHTGLQR